MFNLSRLSLDWCQMIFSKLFADFKTENSLFFSSNNFFCFSLRILKKKKKKKNSFSFFVFFHWLVIFVIKSSNTNLIYIFIDLSMLSILIFTFISVEMIGAYVIPTCLSILMLSVPVYIFIAAWLAYMSFQHSLSILSTSSYW